MAVEEWMYKYLTGWLVGWMKEWMNLFFTLKPGKFSSMPDGHFFFYILKVESRMWEVTTPSLTWSIQFNPGKTVAPEWCWSSTEFLSCGASEPEGGTAIFLGLTHSVRMYWAPTGSQTLLRQAPLLLSPKLDTSPLISKQHLESIHSCWKFPLSLDSARFHFPGLPSTPVKFASFSCSFSNLALGVPWGSVFALCSLSALVILNPGCDHSLWGEAPSMDTF